MSHLVKVEDNNGIWDRTRLFFFPESVIVWKITRLTCEVAEDTEGEGEAGGVSRQQGRLSVT